MPLDIVAYEPANEIQQTTTRLKVPRQRVSSPECRYTPTWGEGENEAQP